jgi:hypothetical protein
MSAQTVERELWDDLAARGVVEGDYVATQRTPWPIRLLMGAAGWLGALFFQVFLLGSVFAATSGNGPAMLVTGLLMLGGAVLLYRMAGERSGRIALGQFALALSLGGQGMAIFGTAETLGGEWLVDRAAFWLGVGVFEVTLYAIVPNIALAGARHYGWVVLPWSLGWLMPLACGVVTVFVLKEHSLAARGEHGRWEPGADATLVFALAAALLVTGATHPLAGVFDERGAPRLSAPWLAGVLTEVVLLLFALCECRRLQVGPRISAAVMVFAALMVMAPAVGAGVLVLALALRRGSLPWLGLGIAALTLGFVWYYGSLQWTLLAKSATLVAAGVLLLAVRIVMRKMEARP